MKTVPSLFYYNTVFNTLLYCVWFDDNDALEVYVDISHMYDMLNGGMFDYELCSNIDEILSNGDVIISFTPKLK